MKRLLVMLKLITHDNQGKLLSKEESISLTAQLTIETMKLQGIKFHTAKKAWFKVYLMLR